MTLPDRPGPLAPSACASTASPPASSTRRSTARARPPRRSRTSSSATCSSPTASAPSDEFAVDGPRAAVEQLHERRDHPRRRRRADAAQVSCGVASAAEDGAQRAVDGGGARTRSRPPARPAGRTRWPANRSWSAISRPSSRRGPNARHRHERGAVQGPADGLAHRALVTGSGAAAFTGPATSWVSRKRMASTSSARVIQLIHWRPDPSRPPRPELEGQGQAGQHAALPRRARARCAGGPPGCRPPRRMRWPPPRPGRSRRGSPCPGPLRLGEHLVAAVAVEADGRPRHEHRRG